MPNLFRIKISHGSSLQRVAKTLNTFISKSRPECSYDINFAVTKNFDVVVHHEGWHEELRRDHGLEKKDVLYEGKAHTDFYRGVLCIAIRFKSTGMRHWAEFTDSKCWRLDDMPAADRARWDAAERERLMQEQQVRVLLATFLKPLVKTRKTRQ